MSNKLKKHELEVVNQPKNTAEDANSQKPQIHVESKATEDRFAVIKEYSSVLQIKQKVDEEIAATNAALGEYLRQLDHIRRIAVNGTGKKREQTYVNGFEIVLDAMPLNELTAMESVVRSYSQRLTTLKMTKEALEHLDQFSDIEDIKYMVLEKEGIPERILVKRQKN